MLDDLVRIFTLFYYDRKSLECYSYSPPPPPLSNHYGAIESSSTCKPISSQTASGFAPIPSQVPQLKYPRTFHNKQPQFRSSLLATSIAIREQCEGRDCTISIQLYNCIIIPLIHASITIMFSMRTKITHISFKFRIRQ